MWGRLGCWRERPCLAPERGAETDMNRAVDEAPWAENSRRTVGSKRRLFYRTARTAECDCSGDWRRPRSGIRRRGGSGPVAPPRTPGRVTAAAAGMPR